MGFFDFMQPTIASYIDPKSGVYSARRSALADTNAMLPSGNFGSTRFNSVKDRLEDGSIMEDWVPRQPTNLHLMFRRIYLRDAIAGSVVDIYSTLPWGRVYDIIGVDDPKVTQMYNDMIDTLGIWDDIPMISREVLIIGRMIGSLAFNERSGLWDSLVPVDPDQAKLTPLPVSGRKPLVDVLSSPAWREFARSTDPRVVEIKEDMNPALLETLQNNSGYIPLDPGNTLFVARRITQNDFIGTSLYTRILPAWAYEMALWNASLTGVRRRNRSILLITAGMDDWEPNDSELNNLTQLFMQADEDPSGAVISVRNGVEVAEVRDPTAIWGISQEFEFLSTLKMRSLGVSEAYLSGEVNVSTMEAAKSSLGKSVNAFKNFMLREIFERQLFPTFARIHNFRKRSQADLAHGIRRENSITAKTANGIPYEDLLIPKIYTEDTLRPEQDPAYLDMMEKLEEKGVPIPIRIWANAAGYDLDKAMTMMEDDIILRQRLAQLGNKLAQESLGPSGGEGGEEAPPPVPEGEGGEVSDLFKGGEEAGTEPGTKSVLPPKWAFTEGDGDKRPLPYQQPSYAKVRAKELNNAITNLHNSAIVRALAKISPDIGPSRLSSDNVLVPFVDSSKELK